MCTAVTFQTNDTYFGRTLDVETDHGEQIVITPRRFVFDFRHTETVRCHHAIIGMARIEDGYPLYFDAVNEKGLAVAGLHFPQNAFYFPPVDDKDNIAPFELIPWLLSQCCCVGEARTLLAKLNLCDTPFSEQLPLSPLHWLIADSEEAIVVEQTVSGLKVFDDPVGVMTNNPSFDYHLLHLCDFQSLSVDAPINRFDGLALPTYSRGMGAIGLPGDVSSASRFVRAAFVKHHAISSPDESHSVSQMFHILGAVEQTRGCVRLSDGQHEYTAYTSCMNLKSGVYYYKTYDGHRIHAIDLHRCDKDGEQLIAYPKENRFDVQFQN